MQYNNILDDSLKNLTKGEYDELSEDEKLAARRGFLKCGLNNCIFGRDASAEDEVVSAAIHSIKRNERCVIFLTKFTEDIMLHASPAVGIWTDSPDIVEMLKRPGTFDYGDGIDDAEEDGVNVYCIRTTVEQLYQSLETETMREAEKKYPQLAKIKQTPLWTDAKGLLWYQNGVPLILLRPIGIYTDDANLDHDNNEQRYTTCQHYRCDAGFWIGQQLLNYYNTQCDRKLIIEYRDKSQKPGAIFYFGGVPFAKYRDMTFAECPFTGLNGFTKPKSNNSNPFKLSEMIFKGYNYSILELPLEEQIANKDCNANLYCYRGIPLIGKQMFVYVATTDTDSHVLAFPLDQYIKMSLEKQLDGSIHRIARENFTCATDDQIREALTKLEEIMTPTLQNGSVEQVSHDISRMKV